MLHLHSCRILYGGIQERPLVRKSHRKKVYESMGKRKNRHCNSKQEVLQREYQRRQQAAGQPEPVLKTQLRTINQMKPAIEKERKKMQERNRRESRNDTDC